MLDRADWLNIAKIDLTEIKKRLRTPLVFDGRNLLDSKNAKASGAGLYFDWSLI